MSPLAQILATANRPAPSPPQVNVATTPVASIYANHDQQAMDAYKQKVSQDNAMWGGLASLGGAGIKAFGPSLLGGAGAAGAAADISGPAMAGLLETLGPAAIL